MHLENLTFLQSYNIRVLLMRGRFDDFQNNYVQFYIYLDSVRESLVFRIPDSLDF